MTPIHHDITRKAPGTFVGLTEESSGQMRSHNSHAKVATVWGWYRKQVRTNLPNDGEDDKKNHCSRCDRLMAPISSSRKARGCLSNKAQVLRLAELGK